MTDSSGTVVNTYTYDPWGNHLTTSEMVSNPFRYAGYRWDEDTGLYYLRARYYSAGIARFLTKDPKGGLQGFPQSLNPYLYVSDNPVNNVDPSGEMMPQVVVTIGGMILLISIIYLYASLPAATVFEEIQDPKHKKPRPILDAWGYVSGVDQDNPSLPGGLEPYQGPVPRMRPVR